MNHRIPLSTLPTAIAFPHATFALRVQDLLLLDLVQRAIEADERIGVALYQPGWETAAKPEIYDVVCLCRVTAHSVQEDGTLNLLVQGTDRGYVLDQQAIGDARHSDGQYGNAQHVAFVAKLEEFFPFAGTVQERLLREELEPLMQAILPRFSIFPTMKEIVGGSGFSLAKIVYLLTAILPMPCRVKQSLLAENNIGRRCRLLLNWAAGQAESPARNGVYDIGFSAN